ncbi:MAG: hypothetical protein LBM12_00470 [Candidatus Nomurabacteria bacterium]|jgi:hypothetical protein|nr:hypothetical protein [Candidatus Nomurabacteria bacterium]
MRYKVLVETGINDSPEEHEMSAATILTYYFKTDVKFMRKKPFSAPDIEVGNIFWEIKSPKGEGKNNIHKHMREASHQSENIVIDLRRMSMQQERAIGHINTYLRRPNRIKRVLIITKNKKVLAIK